MNGTWKLRLADTGALDVGTLGCVQLEIKEQLYFCCCVDGDPLVEAAPPATLVAECGSNGAPDPGEVVTMSFPLRNNGTGLTTDLVATLQASGASLRTADHELWCAEPGGSGCFARGLLSQSVGRPLAVVT